MVFGIFGILKNAGDRSGYTRVISIWYKNETDAVRVAKWNGVTVWIAGLSR